MKGKDEYFREDVQQLSRDGLREGLWDDCGGVEDAHVEPRIAAAGDPLDQRWGWMEEWMNEWMNEWKRSKVKSFFSHMKEKEKRRDEKSMKKIVIINEISFTVQ